MAEKTLTLRGDVEMPALGLGTWQLTGAEARASLREAFRLGYRLIDTSGDYGNGDALAELIDSGEVSRDEIFLTSKVEEDEDPVAAAGERIAELAVDRLDLCLLHRPAPDGDSDALWEGMLEVRRRGMARAVGVSNFSAAALDRLISASGEAPAVNQVEWTPFGWSRELRNHARGNGIVIQAYSPLTRGKRLGDPVVTSVAEKHGRTPAQVLLRWCLDSGVGAVPKATSSEHLAENAGAAGFILDRDDIERLDALDEGWSALGGLPYR